MDRNDLIYWLTKANDAKIVGTDANGLHLSDTALDELFRKSFLKKKEYRGEEIYLRGLVEISNICRKNCLYCGIRRGNGNVARYELTDEEILKDVKFAADAGYGGRLCAVGFCLAAVGYYAVYEGVRGIGVGHAQLLDFGAELLFLAQEISHIFSPPISA